MLECAFPLINISGPIEGSMAFSFFSFSTMFPLINISGPIEGVKWEINPGSNIVVSTDQYQWPH